MGKPKCKRADVWSYRVGERGASVTVYERVPGGPLYARAYDPSLRGRRGGYRRVSLGHRDRDRAITYAHEQAAKLRQGLADVQAGRITLARLFTRYQQHRTPRKSAGQQLEDTRRIEVWTRVLGAGKDPHRITLGEWEAFIDARRSGAIDSRAAPVPEDTRRPVRTRAVEADLKWLRWVLNWGTRWQDRNGHYLLRENVVRGFPIPTEKNPRRPVATQDRYEAVRAVSNQVMMDVRWNGRRRAMRSHLSELLDIANGTGRRISAVLQLRYQDLRLDHGTCCAIHWPADTDKTGRETVVPISPQVCKALDRVLAERPGIGIAYIFPSPVDRSQPVSKDCVSRWLRKAEKLAGLRPLDGSLWHAYRRKWATERKHLPHVDVAAAGGWAGVETLQRCYQQADERTMLQVVLGARELRERKA